MNGTERKIEIFKPFGEAFELMTTILFRPFDLQKWFAIAFAAFLCGHFAAGGFSLPTNFGNRHQQFPATLHMPAWWDSVKTWAPFIIVGAGVVLFVVIILLLWLRARAQFVFTDCIVRNRGAIAEPWREYRNEGNGYFWFGLAVALISMAVFGVVIAILFVSGIIGEHQNPANLVAMFVFIGGFVLVYLVVGTFIGVILFFMPPVMYVQRCASLDAFRAVFRLMIDHLGVFVLYCLFVIVLFMAMGIIGFIVTCATCCLAGLPYVGTVIMLPVFVCLRAFGLLFLRQFGPEYDVWSTLPPPPPQNEPPALPAQGAA